MTYSFTGHRPNKLGGYDDKINHSLIDFACTKLEQLKPDKCISGMAQGWDQVVAAACTRLHIYWIAAIPFPGQADIWGKEGKLQWEKLLSHANEVKYVSPSFSVPNLQKRNEWMVDNSDHVIALHDGSKGGTFNCVKYAKTQGKPITNWWDEWTLFNSDISNIFLDI